MNMSNQQAIVTLEAEMVNMVNKLLLSPEFVERTTRTAQLMGAFLDDEPNGDVDMESVDNQQYYSTLTNVVLRVLALVSTQQFFPLAVDSES